MNDLADEGTDFSTIKLVTKKVNGGYNGLPTRKKYPDKANEVFDND
ncbi:hypothetical protein MATR_01730 [Marivirga tractuosa]|nr:hypothetical protein MATR_01730 [Marivirga tractuosa]